MVRNSPSTALYLLPWLVKNVLENGSDDECNGIHKEILDVLTDSHSSKLERDTVTANRTRNRKLSYRHMCTQAVITLVDHLQTTDRMPSRRKRQRQSGSGVANSTRNVFLQEIPLRTLARASLNIQAYARSLQYLEAALREQVGHGGWDIGQDARTAHRSLGRHQVPYS